LASLRGFDAAPWERATQRPAKPAGDMLPAILKRIRFDQRQGEAEIVRVWRQLLDPTITAHAQPTGLAKGPLVVTVDSHVWLDEIVRYRRKEILNRLRCSFGPTVIQRISFRVG
jgi:predicted nucleic acid-binding Zn ribbon protein